MRFSELEIGKRFLLGHTKKWQDNVIRLKVNNNPQENTKIGRNIFITTHGGKRIIELKENKNESNND